MTTSYFPIFDVKPTTKSLVLQDFNFQPFHVLGHQDNHIVLKYLYVMLKPQINIQLLDGKTP